MDPAVVPPHEPVARQLTREEFLLQMGLAPDDVSKGAPAGSPSTGGIALRQEPTSSALVIASGDAPVVLHDDQWLRSTVFTDMNAIQAESQCDPNNAAKKAIMESFKTRRSYGTGSTPASSTGVGSSLGTPSPVGTATDSELILASIDRKAADLVTPEDHAVAVDYKASLMEEFRKRKKNGEAKVPPVSPPRQRS